jgi:hypothetical protein
MRLIRPAREPGVIATYLRTELDSERFGGSVWNALVTAGVSEDFVRKPDLGDDAANDLRRDLLVAYRGDYFGHWLFELDWSRVALSRAELLEVRLIGWSWWLDVTGGTRMPADGAAWVREHGDVAAHVGILDALEAGRLPELIVVRADADAPLVVLEGHVRLTAFALFPERVPSGGALSRRRLGRRALADLLTLA